MLIARYCQPVREWVIATGMMRGELRECRTPNWRACDWFSPEESQIDKLKYQKAAMDAADYRKQLGVLVLELAKVQAELDK